MLTYDEEQQAAIDDAMAELKRLENDPLVTVEHGTIHQRGIETWAIFGQTAYRLYTENIRADGQLACECAPVVVNGQAIAMWPNEGQGGVLHLQRLHLRTTGEPVANPRWFGNYLGCSWLRVDELNLSNEQIGDIIAEEVLQGSTPLTGRSF